jgi:hypothetical protein
MSKSNRTAKWRRIDGTQISICDMGNAHLVNAIRLHLRKVASLVQAMNEGGTMQDLVQEALERGYALNELVSSTPAFDLSEEDLQYLLVYADHFEEKGKGILAGFFRKIVVESVKHSERKWMPKILPDGCRPQPRGGLPPQTGSAPGQRNRH